MWCFVGTTERLRRNLREMLKLLWWIILKNRVQVVTIQFSKFESEIQLKVPHVGSVCSYSIPNLSYLFLELQVNKRIIMAILNFVSLYWTIVKMNELWIESLCLWVRLCHKPRGVAARVRLHRVCMKCEVASSLLEFLARNLAALAVPSASAVQHMFHFTGTATYFILASTPTPLNSYLSLIHSSVQILFMILLLLSSPASLHCSTPSIT